MSGIYGFWQGPTYRPSTRDELFGAALEQPMSLGATFWDQAKGGVLESFGLGTTIREMTLPPSAPGRWYGDTDQSYAERRKNYKTITEEEYKASPYFRDNVPWDSGMTEDRAAALATMYDAKRVREYFAEKRPITAFFGNLAGQATDPINYIPVAGPSVKAAAVARMGVVKGIAATAALDAAANTAIAGLATRETRRSFGDDVSWQAMVSEIATAALLGTAFGTVGGLLERRAGLRADALRREAEVKVNTLRATQEARIALNEAIGGLANDGEVRLSQNGIAPIERMANETPTPRWDFGDYQPKPLENRSLPSVVFHGTSMSDFDGFDPYSGEYGLMGQGSYFTEDPRIAAEYTTKGKGKSPAVFEASVDIKNPLDMDAPADIKAWRAAFPDYIDDVDWDGNPRDFSGKTNEAIYREIEENLSQDMIPRYEGAEIMQDGVRAMGHDGVTHIGGGRHKDSKGVKHRVWIAFDPDQVSVVKKNYPRIDASPARPEPPPTGRAEAEAKVAKPENYKALADQYRVDPEAGTFPEEAELRQLAQAGRLSDEDMAVLDDADAAFQDGAAYGEALKATVNCLI